MATHRFHPGFCCGATHHDPLPEKVHSVVIWSLMARWDELWGQKSYVPNESTREDLKKASQWLFDNDIITFDPLKDK